ncbi:MAG: 30S ribosomal protein S8 [Archangiaceae bacterium]|nr:30S ribosomal protein S8 [Archangiaceae bacterium]
MPVNDPLGDMVTRIRNGSTAKKDKVVLPHSKIKLEVARVLKEEGFISEFVHHEKKPQGEITLVLKYGAEREPAITGIRRVSKPGLRRYTNSLKIPRVLGGMGISILSTSRGIMSDTQARKQKVGGEIICTVY